MMFFTKVELTELASDVKMTLSLRQTELDRYVSDLTATLTTYLLKQILKIQKLSLINNSR